MKPQLSRVETNTYWERICQGGDRPQNQCLATGKKTDPDHDMVHTYQINTLTAAGGWDHARITTDQPITCLCTRRALQQLTGAGTPAEVREEAVVTPKGPRVTGGSTTWRQHIWSVAARSAPALLVTYTWSRRSPLRQSNVQHRGNSMWLLNSQEFQLYMQMLHFYTWCRQDF